jgi:hypothetical protein
MRESGLYEFGVLSSNVHNAWLRIVAGRFREDFTYSVSVVYNTFPWPSISSEQKAKIEQTAQAVLNTRERYPDCSLADLYYDVAMPSDLLEAHRANDKAVMTAYGFSVKDTDEAACVAALMERYRELTKSDGGVS